MQSSQQYLLDAISWGSTGLIGTILLTLLMWIYVGVITWAPWTWYLMVPADIWIVGFVLVYRTRHKQKPSEPGEPLLTSAKDSLVLVEQQIGYHRNIFWWYILPMAIPMLAATIHISWLKSAGWLDALFDVNSFIIILFLAIFYFTYYLNQRVARTQYEPRRQELLALVAGLSDESTGEHPAIDSFEGFKNTCKPGRWAMVLYFCIMICACIALAILTHLGVNPLGALQGGSRDTSYDGPPRSSGPRGDALARLIVDQRKEKNLVGLAAMIMVDGKVEATAAQGQRKIGSGVSLELTDEWHLGGITKSMTATMMARLVESGRMKWSDTVGQMFPDASIHEDWKTVTLRQLLTDTAGAPKNFPKPVWYKHPPLGPECTEARREAVLEVLTQKPEPSPDDKYVYSNVGYTIAGAMAEKATGATWEDLVKREVFEPLKLASAGFGPPKSPDETLEQPRGHHVSYSWKFPAEDYEDNTPIVGPAGTIRMTLEDLCMFTTEHLRGDLGDGKLLSADTYKLLHAAEPNQYACGWIWKVPVAEIPYTTVYWHNGANTMWYALVVFIPEKNIVVAVTSNDGDYQKAQEAAWEIVKTSVQQLNAETVSPTKGRTD
jgi:CubicO group peptidase (beta-lactamase class C family)